MSKKAQLDIFSNNVEATFSLTCCICSNSFEEIEESLGFIDNIQERIEEFTENAYEEGWRESQSKVYQHIGIHCPECHKNRNNEKHFEY